MRVALTGGKAVSLPLDIPLLLLSVHSAEGRMKRVLIVKKLHPAVTMQSLLTTFGAYGAITGCKVSSLLVQWQRHHSMPSPHSVAWQKQLAKCA